MVGVAACWARAGKGPATHAPAVPPSSVMNSRRFNRSKCICGPNSGPAYRIKEDRGRGMLQRGIYLRLSSEMGLGRAKTQAPAERIEYFGRIEHHGSQITPEVTASHH
jgi:hypothetical protein